MEKSYPWPRGIGPDSLTGYQAKEWYAAWLLMAKAGGVVVDSLVYSDATLYNRGVFYSAANRLAVTSPGANRINVASGAALVDGAMFYNTASIGAAGDIGSPAANPRIDRVVVRKNFGALPYTPAAASVALFSVPAYTARVTVIHGAENVAPVAPTLQHDTTRATYWDIPLYQYQISVAGAITALTDERVWVDAEMKRVYVPPTHGIGPGPGFASLDWGADTIGGVVLLDMETDSVYGRWIVPKDYVNGLVITIILHPEWGASGNALLDYNYSAGACGEDYGTHLYPGGPAAIAVALNVWSCVMPIPLVAASALDIVSLAVGRQAGNGLDTVDDNLRACGWYAEYIGWR